MIRHPKIIVLAELLPNGIELSGQGQDYSISNRRASLVRCSDLLGRAYDLSNQWLETSKHNAAQSGNGQEAGLLTNKSECPIPVYESILLRRSRSPEMHAALYIGTSSN
jgi:hypothetical protein